MDYLWIHANFLKWITRRQCFISHEIAECGSDSYHSLIVNKLKKLCPKTFSPFIISLIIWSFNESLKSANICAKKWFSGSVFWIWSYFQPNLAKYMAIFKTSMFLQWSNRLKLNWSELNVDFSRNDQIRNKLILYSFQKTPKLIKTTLGSLCRGKQAFW